MFGSTTEPAQNGLEEGETKSRPKNKAVLHFIAPRAKPVKSTVCHQNKVDMRPAVSESGHNLDLLPVK